MHKDMHVTDDNSSLIYCIHMFSYQYCFLQIDFTSYLLLFNSMQINIVYVSNLQYLWSIVITSI